MSHLALVIVMPWLCLFLPFPVLACNMFHCGIVVKSGRTLDWESGNMGSCPGSAVGCCAILDKSLIHLPEAEGTMVALDDF